MDEGYTQIPNWLMKSKNLNAEEKMVMFALFSFDWVDKGTGKRKGVVWPTQKQISEITGYKRKKLIRILQNLKQRGILEVEECKGSVNRYKLPTCPAEKGHLNNYAGVPPERDRGCPAEKGQGVVPPRRDRYINKTNINKQNNHTHTKGRCACVVCGGEINSEEEVFCSDDCFRVEKDFIGISKYLVDEFNWFDRSIDALRGEVGNLKFNSIALGAIDAYKREEIKKPGGVIKAIKECWYSKGAST